MEDERALVQAMLAGDEPAFQSFFTRFFPRVYRFALPRLARDADAAQDVAQATLIKAMQALPGFRGEAALFTWLCQICRREVVNHLRAQGRHDDHIVLLEDDAGIRAALEMVEAPPGEQPPCRYDARQTRQLLRTVLDRLPGSYGDALEWKYVEGLSVEEIGTRLGIGRVAAQSLLARAREAFRDALETVFGAEARDILAGLGEGAG